MHKIKVCIATTTYNHVKYIEQCIKSVVEQETNFRFIMVIGDDASTDGTIEIIKKYEKLYPDIIKPIYNKENLGKKGSGGGRENYISVMKKCKEYNPDYIAILDGDDCWLPNKLQIQVEFFEQFNDYALVAHDVKLINENNEFVGYFKQNKFIGNIEDLINYGPYFVNSSVMYKMKYVDIDFFDKNHKYTHGDWLLHIIVAQYGYIGYINEILGCYRKHESGITNIKSKKDILNKLNAQLNILNIASNIYKNKQLINKSIAKLYFCSAKKFLYYKYFDEFKKYIIKARIYDKNNVKIKLFYFFKKIPNLLYMCYKMFLMLKLLNRRK